MANEFVAKKGLISLGSLQVTGSGTIQGDLNVSASSLFSVSASSYTTLMGEGRIYDSTGVLRAAFTNDGNGDSLPFLGLNTSTRITGLNTILSISGSGNISAAGAYVLVQAGRVRAYWGANPTTSLGATFNTGSIMGTQTSQPFCLRTSNLDRMMIDERGRVIISSAGTKLPPASNQLDVVGNISCSAITASRFFGVSDSASSALSASVLYNGNASIDLTGKLLTNAVISSSGGIISSLPLVKTGSGTIDNINLIPGVFGTSWTGVTGSGTQFTTELTQYGGLLSSAGLGNILYILDSTHIIVDKQMDDISDIGSPIYYTPPILKTTAYDNSTTFIGVPDNAVISPNLIGGDYPNRNYVTLYYQGGYAQAALFRAGNKNMVFGCGVSDGFVGGLDANLRLMFESGNGLGLGTANGDSTKYSNFTLRIPLNTNTVVLRDTLYVSGSITGSLKGTASYALTTSYISTSSVALTALSSDFAILANTALTASTNLISGSWASASLSASWVSASSIAGTVYTSLSSSWASRSLSASYSLTTSYAFASYALTGSMSGSYISSSGMIVIGQYNSQLYTSPNGLCKVTWSNGNVQSISWSNGANQVTFSNAAPGGRYVLLAKQPGNGSAGTALWPSAVLWSGGTAPTLTATNNKTDIFGFLYDGTFFYGNSSLNY